jgi:S1-C subfamily serine protease
MLLHRRSFLAAVLLAALCSPVLHAQMPTPLYTTALRSTAWVFTQEGGGTGCLIDRERRLVLTAAHVVAETTDVTVVFPVYVNGQLIQDRDYYMKQTRSFRIPGRVLHREPERDLALIQLASVPRGPLALKLAGSSVTRDEEILRIGSAAPDGQPWKSTLAKVQEVGPLALVYKSGQKVRCPMIASDGPNRPGDSGGPVLNGKGELVGIHVAFQNSLKRSCAIDLRAIRDFLSDANANPQ